MVRWDLRFVTDSGRLVDLSASWDGSGMLREGVWSVYRAQVQLGSTDFEVRRAHSTDEWRPLEEVNP